jgi:hypothetical protein
MARGSDRVDESALGALENHEAAEEEKKSYP